MRMKSNILIIAIDPSNSKKKDKLPAYSVYDDKNGLLRWGFLKNERFDKQLQEIDNLYAIKRLNLGRKAYSRTYLAVEKQYYFKNFDSAAKLIFVRGKLAMCAEMLGWEYLEVAPASWQSAILRCPPRTKSEIRKTLSIKVAKAIAKKRNDEELNVDLADAICIGEFVRNRLRTGIFLDEKNKNG